jgi:hypothetical protein
MFILDNIKIMQAMPKLTLCIALLEYLRTLIKHIPNDQGAVPFLASQSELLAAMIAILLQNKFLLLKGSRLAFAPSWQGGKDIGR